jgi:periplasmic copper chaperone A
MSRVPHVSLPGPRQMAAAMAAGLGLVVAAALPAAAHVTASSPDAAAGGFGKLVLRVPTESDAASTTKVTVTLPADTPFAFVSTKPHPGWTVATTERTLDKPVTAEGFTLTKAVSTVTWTASSKVADVAPGQFDEFELSLGPFPSGVETLSFPATQTYSDGTVVDWDQPSVAGQDEPEHPAPVLELASASAGNATGGTSTTATDVTDTSDTAALWLAGGALLVAVASLVVAAAALRSRTSGLARSTSP